MSKTAAFPKILHIGDRMISDLFDGPVEITEKVDGSQLGFGKVDGELFVRSKGKEQDMEDPDMMFTKAVEYIKTIEDLIPDNHTFYGEWLQKPKHNTLAYDRTPKNGIALFGVYDAVTHEHFGMDIIKNWSEKFDVDCVPLIYSGVCSPEFVLGLVKERVSYLGGQKIEGVVVKAYKPWMFMDQIPLSVMAGKYVTEEFKEVHVKNWKKENTGKGKLEVAISQYKSLARWNKAIQHLRDDGTLLGNPKDIGPLIKEVRVDLETEEKEHIKDQLWEIYKNEFLSSSTDGLPQYYKEQLVKGEINDTDETTSKSISGEQTTWS
jgi:hypothetical protein